MRVWILFSRFGDNPSVVRGIFTDERRMREELNNWGDRPKDWARVELDKVYEEPIVLDGYIEEEEE